jgi:hypothetical protein
MRTLLFLLLAACAKPLPAESPSTSCTAAEYRQLDFWIGDWDLVVRARPTPGAPWAEAKGLQHVESILGGCAISERFRADGPGAPWAGRSYSMWQPALKAWRQTWVDDSGSYLAFTGGVDGDVMTLVGEPRDQDGHHIQMRMVFLDVTARSLRWEWQRQTDGGAWDPQMIIEYRRRG